MDIRYAPPACIKCGRTKDHHNPQWFCDGFQAPLDPHCGCHIKDGGIVFCPMHDAAPLLLAAAERAQRVFERWHELLEVRSHGGLSFELDVAINAAKRVQTS